jgi:hypothetical protein
MIYAKLCRNLLIAAFLIIGIAFGTGCGGGTSSTKTASSQNLIDPSGNWNLQFSDASGNGFFLSALFSQTGAVVTALNISEVGNTSPAFTCIVQRDASMANGIVQNVDQFSGDISGNFGTIHISTTLNAAGTSAVGTYTITPGAAGNCLGAGLTGTLNAAEVPSMTGTWTGTVVCTANCPTGGATTGTITMVLSQDDLTGAITGTYTTSGLLNFVSGSTAPDINDFISGANWQDKLADQNGRNFVIAGGPFQGSTFNNAGVTQNRTFQGLVEELIPTGNIIPLGTMYTINMSH